VVESAALRRGPYSCGRSPRKGCGSGAAVARALPIARMGAAPRWGASLSGTFSSKTSAQSDERGVGGPASGAGRTDSRTAMTLGRTDGQSGVGRTDRRAATALPRGRTERGVHGLGVDGRGVAGRTGGGAHGGECETDAASCRGGGQFLERRQAGRRAVPHRAAPPRGGRRGQKGEGPATHTDRRHDGDAIVD
jgi:hypothetical protein